MDEREEPVLYAGAQPLELRHLVGGRWEVGDGPPMRSSNPARPGVTVATYQDATVEQLQAAVGAAEQARRAWDAVGNLARGRILERAGEGDPTITICREEVLGPILTLLAAGNLDEAITVANATSHGLTASVFTRDERVVRRCLADVEAGLIKVNAPSTGSELHAPFGGLKESAFPAPREQNSQSAADFFTVTKTAYLRLSPEVTGSGR
jgi:alpha-ketoglutaric semialdehyde dehydrogenase